MDNILFFKITDALNCLKILQEFSECLASLRNSSQSELLMFAEKFVEKGNFIVAKNSINGTMGFIAYYANDNFGKCSFVSMIAVLSQYRKMRVGSVLLDYCISDSFNKGMRTIKLEVSRENISAQAFYKKKGFSEIGSASEKSIFLGRSI